MRDLEREFEHELDHLEAEARTHKKQLEEAAIAVIGGIVLLAILLVVTIHNRSPKSAANTSAVHIYPTPSALQQDLQSLGVPAQTPLGGAPARDFTLTNQSGQPVTLSQFRGKVVVLAFVSDQSTNVGPLTSQTLLAALGDLPASAAAQVQVLAVDTNSNATTGDALAYTNAHGLANSWLYLTGSSDQLANVWQAYHVAVQTGQGQPKYTPAIYVIDPNGGEQMEYKTSQLYRVVPAEGYVLATEVATLLPGHVSPSAPTPTLQTLVSTQSITLPTITGQGASGNITLGPGSGQQLTFYFTSWTPNIQQELVALDQLAQQPNAPRLVVVDVGTAEPNAQALQPLLASLSQPLNYPVVVDNSGAVADAYQAQDMPWFTLSDASGNIISSFDGWDDPSHLLQDLAPPTA